MAFTEGRHTQQIAKLGGMSTRGEKKGTAKLTEAQVLLIKASSDGRTALGKRFGVNETTIRRIQLGESWAHVKY